jgi:hypothetical protein
MSFGEGESPTLLPLSPPERGVPSTDIFSLIPEPNPIYRKPVAAELAPKLQTQPPPPPARKEPEFMPEAPAPEPPRPSAPDPIE